MRSGRLAGLVKRLQRPPRDLLAVARAAAVLAVVEALIRWVPLPRLSRLLGVPINLEPAPVDAEPLTADDLSRDTRRLLRSAWAVTDAWPLGRGPCLRRSLVAGHLLRDQRPTLRLGVAGDGETLHAHAWIEIDGRPVERVSDFAVFTASPRT